jgi:hypothetical protein
MAEPDVTPTHRSVLARAAYIAETGGWLPKPVGTLLAGLHRILGSHNEDHPIRRSELQVALKSPVFVNVAAEVLQEHGILDDDAATTVRAWIDRRSEEIPDGLRDEVRAWLLELHTGGDRVARDLAPRSTPTSVASSRIYWLGHRPGSICARSPKRT